MQSQQQTTAIMVKTDGNELTTAERNMNVVSYHEDEIQKPISYERPFNLSSCNACKCCHNTTYIILKCWSNTIVLKAVLFHSLCFGITLVVCICAGSWNQTDHWERFN